jgi:hypothetical protein
MLATLLLQSDQVFFSRNRAGFYYCQTTEVYASLRNKLKCTGFRDKSLAKHDFTIVSTNTKGIFTVFFSNMQKIYVSLLLRRREFFRTNDAHRAR